MLSWPPSGHADFKIMFSKLSFLNVLCSLSGDYVDCGFWALKLCGLVSGHQRFRRTYFLHFQGEVKLNLCLIAA
jgi:hypothetical protein